MSDYVRGDIVNLNRAQSSQVEILTVPTTEDEPYTITLPINEEYKSFTYLASVDDSLSDVAFGLEDVLEKEQTKFSVAVNDDQDAVVIVGPLGLSFEGTTSTNLRYSLIEDAVRAIRHDTGEKIGNCRVLASENSLEKLREYATRDRDGTVRIVNQIRLRELNSANVFEVEADEILTVIEREGTA